MSKELTPLQALKQFRNSQYQGVNVYADELLDIIETTLKDYEHSQQQRELYFKQAKELKSIELDNQKKLKALEIIHEYFIFESEYGGVYFRANKEIPDDKYELLKEILK